jgi:hypothetical protein
MLFFGKKLISSRTGFCNRIWKKGAKTMLGILSFENLGKSDLLHVCYGFLLQKSIKNRSLLFSARTVGRVQISPPFFNEPPTHLETTCAKMRGLSSANC